jgi:hypothetical protein
MESHAKVLNNSKFKVFSEKHTQHPRNSKSAWKHEPEFAC